MRIEPLIPLFLLLTALPAAQARAQWQTVSKQEKAIEELLRKKSYGEALKSLESWKKEKGEQSPEYWIAGANIWFTMGRESTVAITSLPEGKYNLGEAGKESVQIQDVKSGKVVGAITDGPPKIDKAKIRKAIEFLDQAIQLAPNRVDIYTGRAHLYRSMDDLKGELGALESLATEPKAIKGHFETGRGNVLDEPLEDFQVGMLNSYAREHFEKETEADDKAGLEVAKMLVRLFPKKVQGYNLMGVAANYKKDWKEGVKWLDQALAVAPEDSLVIYNKGYSLEKMGDKAGAKKCFEKILLLNNDPEYVDLAKEQLEKLK